MANLSNITTKTLSHDKAAKMLVVGVLCLAGCSSTGLDAESDSLCGAQLGNPCTTIQQADGTARPQRTITESMSDAIASQMSQKPLMAGKTSAPARGAPDGGAPYHVKAYRQPERLATAWIAPRLDEGGIFHEANFVHFVVRQARWGNPRN